MHAFETLFYICALPVHMSRKVFFPVFFALGGAVRRSRSDEKRISIFTSILDPILKRNWSQKGANMEPKLEKNRIKIALKYDFCSKLVFITICVGNLHQNLMKNP